MERREPGSRWTRAGGAARRRDGLAEARARARVGRAEGPGLGRWWSGSRAPWMGRRPGLLASPCLASPLRGGWCSLPPTPLPARPGGARSHPRPEAPSSREQRRRRASCRRPGTLGLGARKRSRAGPPVAQLALLGHRPRPPPRRPQPLSAGVPFAAPRPLPWTAQCPYMNSADTNYQNNKELEIHEPSTETSPN